MTTNTRFLLCALLLAVAICPMEAAATEPSLTSSLPPSVPELTDISMPKPYTMPELDFDSELQELSMDMSHNTVSIPPIHNNPILNKNKTTTSRSSGSSTVMYILCFVITVGYIWWARRRKREYEERRRRDQQAKWEKHAEWARNRAKAADRAAAEEYERKASERCWYADEQGNISPNIDNMDNEATHNG